MELRPYQQQLKTKIVQAWDAGSQNVLASLPTGGGKTVIIADIIKDHGGPAVAIAHRQELVAQISIALARAGVQHGAIGPKPLIKLIVQGHMSELGRSYYNPASHVLVAGVDSMVSKSRARAIADQVKKTPLWIGDEAHHFLRDNKWGRAASMFSGRGLGVTATPGRADGKGLGAHADGIFSTLVFGPKMRELINAGYLSDYRIFAPESDIDLTNVNVTGTGDYSKIKLKTAVRQSHIVGDVVEHYQRIAPGMLGVTFANDVETATDIAARFNSNGIPARIVHGGTCDVDRAGALAAFKRRDILQLVNVDLFGEGFDVPGIEVVSMARPTHSFTVYAQQFGRGLRPEAGKSHAIIIDHVGNVLRHGLPDGPRIWSLDARERRPKKNPDEIPLKACAACTAVFERIHKVCPLCGFEAPPAPRGAPDQIDGDLTEMTPDMLAALRRDIADVDKHPEIYRAELQAKHVPQIGVMANVKRHSKRQEAQQALRTCIAWYGAVERSHGRSDSESYRRFYHRFGVDILSAQALNTKMALVLADKIAYYIGAEAT